MLEHPVSSSGSSAPPRVGRSVAWAVLVILVGLSSYFAGTRASVNTEASAETSFVAAVKGVGSHAPKNTVKDADFQRFWELWTMLKTKYHKQPLDEQKMLYGAMEGLSASLGDPYTMYFPPQDAASFSDSLQGKFEGIGAEIGIKGEQLTVIAPLPDSPAMRAGLLSGDAILAINGTSTEAMSVERAVSLIRGPHGTTVTLTIGRMKTTTDAAGKTKMTPTHHDIKIQRAVISVKSIRVSYPALGIAMIEINHFNADTAQAFSEAVEQVLGKESKALILDLRNDPGGFLDRATAITGEWVGDQVVVQEQRQGKIVEVYHGAGRRRLKGMPTIVLVNEGSASASEIVAGALQDYGVAKLVGTKTFGKGSVQDYVELGDGSALKVTVAEWLTPKGRSINQIGITPDVEVKRTEDDYNAQRDPQLQKALELLGATSTGTRAAK